MTYAYEQGLKIVPQGGNTGLVGGQIPQETGDEIVLSLSRLNTVRSVDPAGFTITVEAGVILETLQNEADKVDRLFPLSLGAQGSCQIGGNISTNAGGTAVLAYGNTRDLVLGLEVVLPSGEIWNGLRTLRKDNTGYDLKQLFIGAEGTLGIITAASLKLFPKPKKLEAAFIGLPTPQDALKLFTMAKAQAGPVLTGFEIMGMNTPLTILGRSGSWLNVAMADGRSGWAYGKYVASTPAFAPQPTPPTVAPSPVSPPTVAKRSITPPRRGIVGDLARTGDDFLSLRAGAGASHSEIARMLEGTEVTMRLSEVFGALHFLRPLCKENDQPTWRDRMEDFLDAETVDENRRRRFIERFNQGYRGFSVAYRECTDAARIAMGQYLSEGETIISDVTSRYGR